MRVFLKSKPSTPTSFAMSLPSQALTPPLVANNFAQGVEEQFRIGADKNNRGKGLAPFKSRCPSNPRGIKTQVIRKNQLPVATNTPAVTEGKIREPFFHGLASKNDSLNSQHRGAPVKLGIEGSLEPCSVEEDGFLRQPEEPRTAFCTKPCRYACVTAERAVYFFGRPALSGKDRSRLAHQFQSGLRLPARRRY